MMPLRLSSSVAAEEAFGADPDDDVDNLDDFTHSFFRDFDKLCDSWSTLAKQMFSNLRCLNS